LGIGLAVARDCVSPSFHLCLPCNACILGDYQGVFQGSFGWFGLFGLGAARAPKAGRGEPSYRRSISPYIVPILRYRPL